MKKTPGKIVSSSVILALLVGCNAGAASTPSPEATEEEPPPTETAQSEPTAQPIEPRRVLIDTDMAVDDWLAILFLLQHPAADVVAVTVTGTGEAHCDPGVRNAQGLLALAGQPNVPVTCGRETPLAGTHTFPEEWRSAVDAMMGLVLPENDYSRSPESAADLIISRVHGSPNPVALVTLGPLTNVAEALQSDPTIIDNIEMITIMGGAVDVPGNLQGSGIETDNTTAEWNIYVDPLAASIVFESGAPITLVALDATNHAPVTMAFYAHIGADHSTPPADFAYGVFAIMQGFIQSGEYYFWDPLTAAVAVDDSLCRAEERALAVVTEEGPESGRTRESQDGNPVQVCVDVDSERFETLFLDSLNGRVP
jgi:inosine-uridine nucleoside N-ribohydrolase